MFGLTCQHECLPTAGIQTRPERLSRAHATVSTDIHIPMGRCLFRQTRDPEQYSVVHVVVILPALVESRRGLARYVCFGKAGRRGSDGDGMPGDLAHSVLV